MADVEFDSLGQRVESLLHEILEESQVFKDGLVAFLEILFLEVGGQVLQEGLLFFEIEVLLDVDTLLDVVTDLLLELVWQVVFVGQLLECLRVLKLLDVL